MEKKKNSRGRPRIHPTSAARKKAYRERKKVEKEALERKVGELEKKLGKLDESNDDTFSEFKKLAFEDVKNMETSQLDKYCDILKSKINQDINLFSPLYVIIDDLIKEYNNFDFNRMAKNNQPIIDETKSRIIDYLKTIQLLTLQHIFKTELGKRKEQDINEIELNLLEQKIFTLEKEIS